MPQLKHELVKLNDCHSVQQQLVVDRSEDSKVVNSCSIIEDCKDLFFTGDALELLHRQHLKL